MRYAATRRGAVGLAGDRSDRAGADANAVATIGRSTSPVLAHRIPGEIAFSLDVRSPEASVMDGWTATSAPPIP